MSRIVCIDAMICVWGVKQQATGGQEHMKLTAQGLFDTLAKEEAILLLPSPVVTELLAPVKPPDKVEIVEKINKLFRVVPVDNLAATKAAEIWHNHLTNWKTIYKKKGDEGIRNRFKYDLLIAAVAITRNVNYFYTEDAALTRLCHGYIEVGPIPPLGMSAQLEFPYQKESRAKVP